MQMGDHASTDINDLATSLRGKFSALYPLSNDCCIYRVPPKIRRSNEDLCTLRIVSIGPFHQDCEELKAMEEHKLRYLQHFLGRTCVTLAQFLTCIKDNEKRLRDCYAETIKLQSQEFIEMMLLDAVFLIEFLLRQSYRELVLIEDRIFTKPWLLMDICRDIWSVENQIPFFILEGLFELAKTKIPENQRIYEGLCMSKLVSHFCSPVCELLSLDESDFENNFSKANHFLDLLRLCIEPPVRVNGRTVTRFYPAVPTITELHLAGVKFRVGSGKHLFDIRFDKGTLEIPKLRMADVSSCFKFLQIFETLHCQTNHINDYAVLLSLLITSPKDAELLIESGIIESTESVKASSFCQELGRNSRLWYNEFRYSGLARDLNAYCEFPWHKWKANLKQNYFSTPWATISVIAAVVLLILTFIQSVCSILGL